MSNKNYLPSGDNSNEVFYPQLDHFDFICGQVMKENRTLRFVVIISCLSFLLSIGITIYAVSMPDSVPVLVTMNDFGETKYVGPVSRKNYQNYYVPEEAINYQVKNFIDLYYSLSTDITVMRKNYSNIFHILTTQSASKFNTLVKESNLYGDFGEKTRECFFETEPLKLSQDSYQLDYQIILRGLEGNISERKKYRILVTVKTLQPSEEDIKFNPLGIYITNFDIKEIETFKE